MRLLRRCLPACTCSDCFTYSGHTHADAQLFAALGRLDAADVLLLSNRQRGHCQVATRQWGKPHRTVWGCGRTRQCEGHCVGEGPCGGCQGIGACAREWPFDVFLCLRTFIDGETLDVGDAGRLGGGTHGRLPPLNRCDAGPVISVVTVSSLRCLRVTPLCMYVCCMHWFGLCVCAARLRVNVFVYTGIWFTRARARTCVCACYHEVDGTNIFPALRKHRRPKRSPTSRTWHRRHAMRRRRRGTTRRKRGRWARGETVTRKSD